MYEVAVPDQICWSPSRWSLNCSSALGLLAAAFCFVININICVYTDLSMGSPEHLKGGNRGWWAAIDSSGPCVWVTPHPHLQTLSAEKSDRLNQRDSFTVRHEYVLTCFLTMFWDYANLEVYLGRWHHSVRPSVGFSSVKGAQSTQTT